MDWVEAVTKGGLVTGLLVLTGAFIHGDIVPGYVYRRERDRADALLELSLGSADIVEKGVTTAEKALDLAAPVRRRA